jgi:hypothetical protein
MSLGESGESRTLTNENHSCARKTSKRCVFCDIGSDYDDVKSKLIKSIDLFDGIYWSLMFKS